MTARSEQRIGPHLGRSEGRVPFFLVGGGPVTGAHAEAWTHYVDGVVPAPEPVFMVVDLEKMGEGIFEPEARRQLIDWAFRRGTPLTMAYVNASEGMRTMLLLMQLGSELSGHRPTLNFFATEAAARSWLAALGAQF